MRPQVTSVDTLNPGVPNLYNRKRSGEQANTESLKGRSPYKAQMATLKTCTKGTKPNFCHGLVMRLGSEYAKCLPPFLATRRGDGGDSVREGASERLQHAVQEAQHHQKDYLGQSDPSLPALHLKNPAGSVK